MEPVVPELEPPEEQEHEQQEDQFILEQFAPDQVIELIGLQLVAQGRDDLPYNNPEYFLRRLKRSVKLAIGKFIAEQPMDQLNGPTTATFPFETAHALIAESEFYFFKTVTFWERESDAQCVELYDPNFLLRSHIHETHRIRLIEWMKLVHMWMGIRTRSLHVAVGLMDLYTWIRPILLRDYQLLALAALALATRFRSPNERVNYIFLSIASGFSWTQHQIVAMETLLRDSVGRKINFPTPHRFLDIYIYGLTDFSSTRKKWARIASEYLLDLGLNIEQLCEFSASMRCCAVLYLLRFILRRHCDCTDSESGEGNVCPYAHMPAWPEQMRRITAVMDSPTLRFVALLYGTILWAVIEICVPFYLQTHVAATESATFNKYVGLNYGMIAIDPVLIGLTEEEINDIIGNN